MLKEFDEFVDFCFEHGGTLRNHKQFGEMARKLRPQIEAAQQSFAPDVAKYCPQCGNKYDGVLCGECGFTTSPRR